jgi:hypothetical protein
MSHCFLTKDSEPGFWIFTQVEGDKIIEEIKLQTVQVQSFFTSKFNIEHKESWNL